ncbi:hypothetical protein TruAng_010629 [Truncatella angustata]|nr:hypothetical protein TruAng_010629 [Truncatella angustata]
MNMAVLRSNEDNHDYEGHGPASLPIDDAGNEKIHVAARNETLPEYSNTHGYNPALMSARTTLSADEEKKLLRRIDWHLIPLMAVIYCVKTIDASNVSNARIMDQGTNHNILTELHMTSDQYNFVTLAYYIPYILAEAPSNLLVKKMKPSVWNARIQISWGVVLCCHAALTNATGLYVVRAFLGFFEAGLWPGLLLQLVYWYRPDELAPRIVLVTIVGNFSSVFSGVLAFAFNGVTARGLSGWKWLILTEGIFTILLGIFTYFFLADFPAQASWLSEKEKAFVQARLPSNAPRDAEKNFDLHEFIQTLKDKRLWLFLLCWAFYTVGTTGLNFYQPTVIANLGFTTGGVYAATVIAGGFSTAWYTMMWPWRVQTTQGATGSAFAIAFANSYGQIGGAVGSQLFNSRYAPRYTTSFGIAMGFIGMAIIMNIITWSFTWRVDMETRRIKRARIAAAKRNETVLDDVEINGKGNA